MLRIKEARLKAGLTQPQFLYGLALRGCNISVPDLSRYENGHAYPTPKQAIVICRTAGVTLGELARPSDVRFCAQVVRSAQRPKRAEKRQKSGRIAFRVLESEKPLFDEAIELCGYGTTQNWGEQMTARLLDEAAERKAEREYPPEGTAPAIDANDPDYNPYPTTQEDRP